MPILPDLNPGQTFNDLIVLTKSTKTGKSGSAFYDCACICGQLQTVNRFALTSGKVKSCGCRRGSSRQKPPGESSLLIRFNMYIRSAILRDLDFTLTLSEFKSLIAKECYHCGQKPLPWISNSRVKHPLRHLIFINGIDRVDNKRGYYIDNCVPCCTTCNRVKSNRTTAEFLAHSELIVLTAKGRKNVTT